MTTIKEVLEKYKCKTCEQTDIADLELFTEFNSETKKVNFYVYCEACQTAQGIQINKPIRVEDYLLKPMTGAG